MADTVKKATATAQNAEDVPEVREGEPTPNVPESDPNNPTWSGWVGSLQGKYTG